MLSQGRIYHVGNILIIEMGGKFKTKLYDKRDDFTFLIFNLPFISSNIPASPAYVVYISQLMRYSRATTVIVDTELSCLLRSYSNKATLLLI